MILFWWWLEEDPFDTIRFVPTPITPMEYILTIGGDTLQIGGVPLELQPA